MVRMFTTRIMQVSKPKSNSSQQFMISGERKETEGTNLKESIHSLKDSICKLITRIEDAEDIVTNLKQNIQSMNNKLYALQD